MRGGTREDEKVSGKNYLEEWTILITGVFCLEKALR